VTKILARYKLLKKFLIYSYEILDLSSPNIRQNHLCYTSRTLDYTPIHNK
jgi:hypothetical protein